MARVLITGGAGFIGAHAARRFAELGHEVVVVDAFHQYIHPVQPTFVENMDYRYGVLLKDARIERASTGNKDALRRLIRNVAPDRIVHLAALPLANVALRQTEEAFEGIVEGTMNMLEILRDEKPVERFVYVSSSMIYGDFTADPQPEDAPKDPKEIYGGLKYCGEIMVKVYARRFGIPFSIVRPSAVYGPTDNNRRVIQAFVENAFRGKPLKVDNGASTMLDFTYVEDAAAGLVAIALAPGAEGEAFNMTAGRAFSLAQVVETIRKHIPDIEVVENEDKESFRPKRGTLDVSKAARLTGWAPQVGLEDGVARYIEHVRRHNPSLANARKAP